MITVNGTTYNAENKISSRDALNAVFAAVLANTDLTAVAALKEHLEKVDGVKTDNVTGMFLTTQLRLPGVQAVTYADGTWYTKHAAVKIDLFNISESEYATSPSAVAPKAATISKDALAEKLAAIRTNAAKKAV